MSFVLIYDPDPLLGSAPRFLGPFSSEAAAKGFAEDAGMTGGEDFDLAAAAAVADEGSRGAGFPCAVARLESPRSVEPT
ncbi:hypothetical protein WDZ11_22285 (plasmid) [Roseomonas mucosa]|uniref:hypothetical protein n=1 Tax=Roseomonas mucosa TaxID=207340 RepID=UPI0030CA93F5